ncbi:hypothetical protein DPMN_115920 [Dreissena polymorpha]|uniref:Uncharacterized protein n=1 Tax=Dreissena polymorpha TaxID=45954 RepID=A0A9D4KMV8_DREPO|nr:hypothetical protein DPMN_115920 [Dreissena polymorpha]
MFVSSETHLYQVRLLQQARSRPEVIGRVVTLSATTVEKFIAPPATKFEPCPDDEVQNTSPNCLPLPQMISPLSVRCPTH